MLLKIEGARRRTLVWIFSRPLQGVAELLLEQAVAILVGHHFALEDFLSLSLPIVEAGQKFVEAFARPRGRVRLAVVKNFPGRRVENEVTVAVRTAQTEFARLAHRAILALALPPHRVAPQLDTA